MYLSWECDSLLYVCLQIFKATTFCILSVYWDVLSKPSTEDYCRLSDCYDPVMSIICVPSSLNYPHRPWFWPNSQTLKLSAVGWEVTLLKGTKAGLGKNTIVVCFFKTMSVGTKWFTCNTKTLRGRGGCFFCICFYCHQIPSKTDQNQQCIPSRLVCGSLHQVDLFLLKMYI